MAKQRGVEQFRAMAESAVEDAANAIPGLSREENLVIRAVMLDNAAYAPPKKMPSVRIAVDHAAILTRLARYGEQLMKQQGMSRNDLRMARRAIGRC